jgi:DNA-binding GntR family transcriptional regulator
MPTTKADEITLVIEDAIVSGELSPGTVLRQELLSAEFGVSRTPVREALRQLVALGLVDFEPNRGVRVRAVSREELREAFLIRAELEELAAGLAVPRITKLELRTLGQAERRFAELTQRLRSGGGDELERRYLTADWVRANDAFHDVFLQAAGAPLLWRMAKSVRRVFHGQAAWSASPEIDALYKANLTEHQAIREAFERKDDEVRRHVSKHVLNSGVLLERHLDQAATEKPRLLAGRPRARTASSGQ